MSKNFNDDQIKAIHSRFANLRKNTETANQKAISQRELARRTGLTFPRISNLENENDDTEPSIADLLAYRNYFNVSVDYLLCLEDEPTTDISVKAISKEYGLSSDSLNHLKRLIMRGETGLFGSPVKTLNTLIENINFLSFLWAFEVYLDFYPSSTKEYAAFEIPFDESEQESLDLKKLYFDLSNEKKLLHVTADQYAQIALDCVKERLVDIKKSSDTYLKNVEKDLQDTQSAHTNLIKFIEKYEADFFEEPSNTSSLKREYESKIAKLERVLEDGKKRR